MKLNAENVRILKALASPLVKWLNENGHPHATIIIDQNSVEITEGAIKIPIPEYLTD